MVLAGLGLNPAGVSLFRMHAPQSPLTRNWLPLEASVLAFFGPWSWWLHHLLFVVALHHLSVSLGRQNATLGSFTAHGFGRFGLESCWGSPVSDACPTEPFDEELASAWGLNPRVFGHWSWWLHHLLFVVTLHHLSVSLGRQNATLGSFTGEWFWQVWAWILLGFPCFGCVPHKALLTRNWFPLEAWILAFSGLDLGGCSIFCLWLHCIIFLFL